MAELDPLACRRDEGQHRRGVGRRSVSTISAGSTVKQANAHSSTPQPAIQPSSATALKSANMAAKNASAVPTAAVRMPARRPPWPWMRGLQHVRPGLAARPRSASGSARRNRPCRSA